MAAVSEFRNCCFVECLFQRVLAYCSTWVFGCRYPKANVGSASGAIAAAQAGFDPLEEFCKSAPDADECRVYES